MNKLLEENKQWIDEVWAKTEAKLQRTSVSAGRKLPLISVDGVYDDHSVKGVSAWTNGFWPGIMWLMYSATGEEKFKEAAEYGENALDKAMENYCNDGYVPRLDFRQPDEPHYIDSSAGAIAACGLIEIAKAVPERE